MCVKQTVKMYDFFFVVNQNLKNIVLLLEIYWHIIPMENVYLES
jgi:hypothetical protein